MPYKVEKIQQNRLTPGFQTNSVLRFGVHRFTRDFRANFKMQIIRDQIVIKIRLFGTI